MPDTDAQYHSVGQAHALLVKHAAAPVASPKLAGRLYLSKTGWLLLSVPNALLRGLFSALNEPGVELPYHTDGTLNAHISVCRKEEVERAGGPEAFEKDRGRVFHYQLAQVETVEPSSWDGVSRVWMVRVKSPELETLRKSYGLTALPKNNEHAFHLTFAVRRTNVLRANDVAKAAAFDVSALPPDRRAAMERLMASLGVRHEAGEVVVAEPGDGGMLSTDDLRDLAACKRAAADDEKPADCTCEYPAIRMRNMIGHPRSCGAYARLWAERAKQAAVRELPSADELYHQWAERLAQFIGKAAYVEVPHDEAKVTRSRVEKVIKTLPAGDLCGVWYHPGPPAKVRVSKGDWSEIYNSHIEHRLGLIPGLKVEVDAEIGTPSGAGWEALAGGENTSYRAEEFCPACDAQCEGDPYDKTCNSCGHKYEEKSAEAERRSKETVSAGRLTIKVEYRKGDTRKGKSADGKPWSRTMEDAYGRIEGTKGADGDALDVFLGPDYAKGLDVYVVSQVDPDTEEFDEHKVMMGYASKADARAAYLRNYPAGWKGLGSIAAHDWEEFEGLYGPPVEKQAAEILPGWSPDPASPIAAFEGFSRKFDPAEVAGSPLADAAMGMAPVAAIAGGIALLRRRRKPAPPQVEKQADLSSVGKAIYAQLPGLHAPDMAVGGLLGAGAGLAAEAWNGKPGKDRWKRRLGAALLGGGLGAAGANLVGDRARRYVSNTVLPWGYAAHGPALSPTPEKVWRGAILDQPVEDADTSVTDYLAEQTPYAKDTLQRHALPARRELLRRQMGVHTDDDADIWRRTPAGTLELNPANPATDERAARFAAGPETIDTAMFRDPAKWLAGDRGLVDPLSSGLFGAAVTGGQEVPHVPTAGGGAGRILDRFDYSLDPKENDFLRDAVTSGNVLSPSWRAAKLPEQINNYYGPTYGQGSSTNGDTTKSLIQRWFMDKVVAPRPAWVDQRFEFQPPTSSSGNHPLQILDHSGAPLGAPVVPGDPRLGRLTKSGRAIDVELMTRPRRRIPRQAVRKVRRAKPVQPPTPELTAEQEYDAVMARIKGGEHGSRPKLAAPRADAPPLSDYQDRVGRRVNDPDGNGRVLVYHGLGTGKTRSAITAAEQSGDHYAAVVPAALRPNFEGEIDRWTDGGTPSEVLSYTQVAQGHRPATDPGTLIVDEAHRLRNPESAQTRAVSDMAARAKRLVLLSGSPVINAPGDLAVPMSLLTGEKITPEAFERRYVGTETVRPGFWGWLRGVPSTKVPAVAHEDELLEKLKGKVDYQAPKDPQGVSTNDQKIEVPLSRAQESVHRLLWNQVPWITRWKLENDFPISKSEAGRLRSFLSGPRQAALSTYPFQGKPDAAQAFDQSAKLRKAYQLLREKLDADPRNKALVYSNFPRAGLVPYAAGLARAGIPYSLLDGSLNDAARKEELARYNAGKSRVLLYGPSAAEGISTKGTQLIQLLDPHWNESRMRQARGRGLRFDSHADLPDTLKAVTIQRFTSKSPEPGFVGRLFGGPRVPTADEVLERQAARREELLERFRDVLRRAGSEPAPPVR